MSSATAIITSTAWPDYLNANRTAFSPRTPNSTSTVAARCGVRSATDSLRSAHSQVRASPPARIPIGRRSSRWSLHHGRRQAHDDGAHRGQATDATATGSCHCTAFDHHTHNSHRVRESRRSRRKRRGREPCFAKVVAGARQVRSRDQSQDCEGAWSDNPGQALKEIAPSVSQVLVMVNAGNAGNAGRLRAIHYLAAGLYHGFLYSG